MILLYEKDYSLLDLTYLSSDPIKNVIQTLIDRKILKNYVRREYFFWKINSFYRTVGRK